jgi:hypothetical protein
MSDVIDKSKLVVPEGGPHASPELGIETVDGVIAILTQVFCPNGHNLVDNTSVTFNDQKGISLLVNDGEHEDVVVVSPYHGDPRKAHAIAFRIGDKLALSCPICKEKFPTIVSCSCGKGDLVGLYLTPALTDSHIAAVCNVWGCPRSRIVDNWQIISQFVDAQENSEAE